MPPVRFAYLGGPVARAKICLLQVDRRSPFARILSGPVGRRGDHPAAAARNMNSSCVGDARSGALQFWRDLCRVLTAAGWRAKRRGCEGLSIVNFRNGDAESVKFSSRARVAARYMPTARCAYFGGPLLAQIHIRFRLTAALLSRGSCQCPVGAPTRNMQSSCVGDARTGALPRQFWRDLYRVLAAAGRRACLTPQL